MGWATFWAIFSQTPLVTVQASQRASFANIGSQKSSAIFRDTSFSESFRYQVFITIRAHEPLQSIWNVQKYP
jgi:hypothetical protein